MDIASISYEDFLEKLCDRWQINRYQIRRGQTLMNLLHSVWPDEYKRLSSAHYYDTTDIDCFYNDNLIPNTLVHLENVWEFEDKEEVTECIEKIIRDYTVWLSSYHIVTFNRQNIDNVVKEYLENGYNGG